MNGCYENLSGGLTSEALTDFTGGISERFKLREDTPPDLFNIMLKAAFKGAMMSCHIEVGIMVVRVLNYYTVSINRCIIPWKMLEVLVFWLPLCI